MSYCIPIIVASLEIMIDDLESMPPYPHNEKIDSMIVSLRDIIRQLEGIKSHA